MKEEKLLSDINKHLEEIDKHVMAVKKLLFKDRVVSEAEDFYKSPDGKIIEGVFDGEKMIDADGNDYSVSPNYASKSLLVVGDKLKLTVGDDGRFVYKQIGPVERQHIIGQLDGNGDNYFVQIDDRRYRVLKASVTYFKANVGDKLTLVIPADGEADWAAIENKIIE